jgi:hypothetical protein
MVGYDRPTAEALLASAGLRMVEYLEPEAPQTPLPGQTNMIFNAARV